MEMTIPAPTDPSMRATKPSGIWLGLAFIAYFGLSGAVAAFIHNGTSEGIAEGLGRALGTLLIPTLIALVLARRKKKSVRFDIVLICSAIIHLSTQYGPITSTIDANRLAGELRGVPPESVPATLLASQTNIGRNMGNAIRLLDAYNTHLQNIDSEIDDAAFAELLEPRRLADPEWRTSILPILARRREAAAGYMARLDALASEANARVMSMATPGMTDSARTQFRNGVAESLQNNRPPIAAYVTAMERYLSVCAEMIRFLSTPEGRPTLNAEGRIDFQTQGAIDEFLAVAGRVDNAHRVLIESAQTLVSHQQQGQQRLRNLGR